MAKFNYKGAEKTAARIIAQFGETVNMLRYTTTYDPIAGAASNEKSQVAAVKLVSIPATNDTIQSFDNDTAQDFVQGKLRFFLIAAQDIGFTPLSGDYIGFEDALWEVSGATPINPAGIALLYRVGVRLSNKAPTDIVAPVVTVTLGNDTVENGIAWVDAGATADTGETVIASGTVNVNVDGTYTITYTATDAAGNVGTATRTVTVVDTIAPFITVTAGTDEVQPNGTWIDAGAVSDTGEAVVATGTVDTAVIGTYTITYTATDAVGNVGTATRTVTVADTIAPVITVTPGTDEVQPNGTWVDAGAVSDTGEVVVATGTVDTAVIGTYTITYTATDAAGNVGTATRTVTVELPLADLNPYYHFDPSSLSAGPVTSWNGQFVGSDNDANLTITQTTSADQPTAAGTVVTFNDNTDHLAVPAGFVEPPGGSWQVVGTTLGTFAYEVNANAVSELNLLGNLGATAYRQSGDLYGIILLPSSATGQDTQRARELLIGKGAGDGVVLNATSAWRDRQDIVQFNGGDMSGVTNVASAWFGCSSLTSFSSDLPSATNASGAWRDCTSLTSFSSDLASSSNVSATWRGCSSLTSFSSNMPLVSSASYAWFVCSSLTSFSSALPSVTNMFVAWLGCSSLTDFSAGVFANWNPSSISSGVFNRAWESCTSLTAQSVENILTSIDSSGKYATSTGASGGSALADAGIDISYDGTTLSAATNTAVTSLKSKGWSIIVNNVTL